MELIQGNSISVICSLCIAFIVTVFMLSSHFDAFMTSFPESKSINYTSIRLTELQSKVRDFDDHRLVDPPAGSITGNNQSVSVNLIYSYFSLFFAKYVKADFVLLKQF